MRENKKKFALLTLISVLCICVLLAFSACGEGEDTGTSSNTVTGSVDVTETGSSISSDNVTETGSSISSDNATDTGSSMGVDNEMETGSDISSDNVAEEDTSVGSDCETESSSATDASTDLSEKNDEYEDANGFIYSLEDGKMVVVGFSREIGDWLLNGIKIPDTFDGVEVAAIADYAFKDFGEVFTNTQYANLPSSYVMLYVPTSIKKIGTGAFESCNGIKVTLYDPNQTYADYKSWDATVTWGSKNRSARDCIWGFRPAIGWTRYSKVEIPEGYDTVTD